MANIPYGGEGVPSGVDTQEFSYVELLAGHTPEFLTVPGYKGDGSQAIAAFTVVGVGADGFLTPAIRDSVDPEDDIQALGFTAAPILASGDEQGVGLVRGGNFNVDALTFDASFNTDAEKLAAFEGAPTPTNIVLQKVG